MIGTAVLVIVILALGYVLGIAPKLAEAGASALQVQQAQGQNQAQQATLTQLEGQYKNIGALRAKLASLQLSVPSTADGEDFVTEINSAMKTSQTTLDTITLAEPVPFATGSTAASTTVTTPGAGSTPTPAPTSTAPPVAASGATSDAATAPTPVAGASYTVAVVITVEGSPDQVFQFDNLMQTGPRLFLTTTVAFQSQNASASGAAGSSASSTGGGSSSQSSQSGVLSGYIFVVSGTDVEPTPTAIPTPNPTDTSIPTTTPTPTNTPKP
jgi:hypothetical protein